MRLVVSAGLGLLLMSCSGGKPSTPSFPAPVGLSATVIPEVGGRTVVELTWEGGNQATSYSLEAGTQPGTYNLPRIEFPGPATAYRWLGVPVGNLYVRLRARGSGGEATSEELLIGSVDPRNVIDAILLGSGPLAVAENQGCSRPPFMAGWRPGSQVAIRVSTGVRQSRRASAEAVVPQVSVATAGNVTAYIAPTGDADPTPAVGEITLADIPTAAMRTFCACTNCVGCAQSFSSAGFTNRVRIVMGDNANDSTPPHEIGHGIGACHMIAAAGFTPPPTMGVSLDGVTSPRGRLLQLEPATLKAMETTYAAGLVAGASRGSFISKGLVPPDSSIVAPGVGSTSGVMPIRWPAGWRVEILGPDEYVVTKPICTPGL